MLKAVWLALDADEREVCFYLALEYALESTPVLIGSGVCELGPALIWLRTSNIEQGRALIDSGLL